MSKILDGVAWLAASDMGFVSSPDCYLDLHQISASTCYTLYEIHTLSSTRLGSAGYVSQKYGWSGHGVLSGPPTLIDIHQIFTGCLKSEREELEED